MEVYKNSFVDLNEFEFEHIILYFENLFDRTRSNYETLMDPFPDKVNPKLK